MMRSPSTPLDVVLAMAVAANTDVAQTLLVSMRAGLHHGDDSAAWIGAVQIARDTGALEVAPAIYLLDIITESVVGRLTGTDPILLALDAQMREFERVDGLGENEAYLLGEAPAPWLELNARWEGRFTQLRVSLLEQAGESRLARLCQLRPAEFDALSREGWAALMPAAEG